MPFDKKFGWLSQGTLKKEWPKEKGGNRHVSL